MKRDKTEGRESRRRSGKWVRKGEERGEGEKGGEGVGYGREREKEEGRVREVEKEWNIDEKGRRKRRG